MLSVIKKAIAKLTGNATSADVLSGKTFYSTDPRTRQTGSIPTVTHLNPTASINTSTGVVTASHTQSAGYVASSGTTTGTLNLSTQAAKTVTPTMAEQTAVAANKYTTGAVKVAGASLNVLQSGSVGDAMNNEVTLTSAVTNGILVVTAAKEGSGTLYAFAKNSSGVTLSGKLTHAERSYSTSRAGVVAYRISGAVGAKFITYAHDSNSSATSGNNNCAQFWEIIGI